MDCCKPWMAQAGYGYSLREARTHLPPPCRPGRCPPRTSSRARRTTWRTCAAGMRRNWKGMSEFSGQSHMQSAVHPHICAHAYLLVAHTRLIGFLGLPSSFFINSAARCRAAAAGPGTTKASDARTSSGAASITISTTSRTPARRADAGLLRLPIAPVVCGGVCVCVDSIITRQHTLSDTDDHDGAPESSISGPSTRRQARPAA